MHISVEMSGDVGKNEFVCGCHGSVGTGLQRSVTSDY